MARLQAMAVWTFVRHSPRKILLDKKKAQVPYWRMNRLSQLSSARSSERACGPMVWHDEQHTAHIWLSISMARMSREPQKGQAVVIGSGATRGIMLSI